MRLLLMEHKAIGIMLRALELQMKKDMRKNHDSKLEMRQSVEQRLILNIGKLRNDLDDILFRTYPDYPVSVLNSIYYERYSNACNRL